MQRHGCVEIGLFRAHFDGNAQNLRHFTGVLAEDMHAQDAIVTPSTTIFIKVSPPPESAAFKGRKFAI